jgi:hypothetical protein
VKKEFAGKGKNFRASCWSSAYTSASAAQKSCSPENAVHREHGETIEQSIASTFMDSTGGVKLNEEVGPDYLK